jgi:hypothetical protein
MVIKAEAILGRTGWPKAMQQVNEAGVVIRYQIAFSPIRYAFLIRHYNHYCGYALVPASVGPLALGLNLHRNVTYAGTGSRYIGWYRVGENGQLNHQHQVNLHDARDCWVGFDLSDEESKDFEFALEELSRFSAKVLTFIERRVSGHLECPAVLGRDT